MATKKEIAAGNHGNGYTCSQAVYCAFTDVTGLSDAEAAQAAKPYSGGRAIKCGAVMAAEMVLKQKMGEEASQPLIEEFERRFTERNKSIICKELRGGLGKPRLRTCRGCVEDSAELLEAYLAELKTL